MHHSTIFEGALPTQSKLRVTILTLTTLLGGCVTSPIGTTVKALKAAGGSIFAPPTYIDESFLGKLEKLKLGENLAGDSLGFFYRYLTKINQDYAEYVSVLTAGRAGLNVAYDSLTLGLSGAATIFSPVATKTALSGLSTFFQGQKSSIDENLFNDRTIFALTAITEARRFTVLQSIRTKVANREKTAYPLGEAVIDLNELYRAGTLQTALQAAYINGAASATKAGGTLRQTEQEGSPGDQSSANDSRPLGATTSPEK